LIRSVETCAKGNAQSTELAPPRDDSGSTCFDNAVAAEFFGRDLDRVDGMPQSG
jgi:hypothetical protein